MERLVNKLRAYCEPAQNIIRHSDDPGAAFRSIARPLPITGAAT